MKDTINQNKIEDAIKKINAFVNHHNADHWQIFKIGEELNIFACEESEERGGNKVLKIYAEISENTGISFENVLKISEKNKPISAGEYLAICDYIGFDLIDKMYNN